jgi:hypothetical protein
MDAFDLYEFPRSFDCHRGFTGSVAYRYFNRDSEYAATGIDVFDCQIESALALNRALSRPLAKIQQ